ncbi:efflux RND transporter periplasmic adaptor subunit [Pleomorphovibrio marinus]|uniref:efflux RND transporter periplasmic adaptor subunit n=1 Tax=Pleomorphovibrio marinus TaxID=2164132 RepID=UPI001E499DB6|nr:efflux RND transporter periplasmic adaptor subunit [Pleomorphovibrio marinus]
MNHSLMHSCLCALLPVLMMLTSSCSEGSSKDTKGSKPLEVPVFTLSHQSIEIPQTYVCDLQAVQFVEVRAKVEGYVEKIFVDEGEEVQKGDPLFQLSSREYVELVNSARARLMQARAEAQSAQLDVDRLRILVEKKIYADSELKLAQSKKDMAQSSIQEAESLLKNAEIGLSYTTIRAPFDGMVDRIPYKTGSLVKGGDLLTNITDIHEIFAYYRITENEYLTLRNRESEVETDSLKEALIEEELTLVLSNGEIYPHKGRLETMEADFERGTGSIALRVRFPNPEGLIKHGASGKILMTNRLDNVFLIPQKSTFEIQDYTYAFMLGEDNAVKVRSFQPVSRQGLFYVDTSFQQGDRIILEGLQLIKDGDRVQPEAIPIEEVYRELNPS